VANTGYKFGSWTPSFPSTVTGSATYTANFVKEEYTLSIDIVGNGSVAKATDQATYHYGDVVTLTPTAAAGWTFGAFSGDTTTNSITMNGNRSVTATFTQQTKLVITSDPQTINPGSVTGMITVQLQDNLGHPVKLTHSVTIDLSTDSAGGSFAINGNGTPPITQVTIFAGLSTANFYYKDMNGPGTPTIKVTNAELGSDTQVETVRAPAAPAYQIVFTSVPTTLKAGNVSSLITIQIRDSFNQPVKVTNKTIITLTSSSGGAFATNGNGSPVIITVTINPGTSTASFYYKNGSVGAATITVSGTVGGESLTQDAYITIY
jgi:hypothetical protein